MGDYVQGGSLGAEHSKQTSRNGSECRESVGSHVLKETEGSRNSERTRHALQTRYDGFHFPPNACTSDKKISAVYLYHAIAFFAQNRESIIGEIQSCLQITLGTRRKEIIAKLKLCPIEKSIADCFHSSKAVNGGVYLSTTDCSIGDRRFCQNVISAFRIKGIPAKVTLPQLAFTCTKLTREYKKRNTCPSLFELVPSASGSKMEYEKSKRCTF